MAGILPGTGKDPLLLLSKQPDARARCLDEDEEPEGEDAKKREFP